MERAPLPQPRIKNLSFKVGLVLALIPLAGVALVVYVLYARGVFEPTRKLTLIAHDTEGVIVGMPVTFSGFPIGQVAGMALSDDGQVRVEIQIRKKDARWLRTSSVFTLDKGMWGSARIRATTPKMQDPPLGDDVERQLVTRDAAKDIPQVIAKASSILDNIDAMTRPDSSLNQSLAHLQALTDRMSGEYGLIEGVTGSPEHAKRVMETVDRVSSLIASLNGVAARLDGVLAKTDQRVFGQGGMMDEAHKSVAQLNAVLGDARDSLKKADAVLADAQVAVTNAKSAASNVKDATTDLVAMRAQVDESIRNVNHLIDEINRKWPFAQDAKIKLP